MSDDLPRTNRVPLWRRALSFAITIAVVVVVFGFVIPQFADYDEVFDSIADLSAMEWIVLSVLAGWFLVAYVFVLMATIPSLRFGEGLVVQSTGTAINNAIPAGGAIALPLQYLMFMSWGFTPGAVTSSTTRCGGSTSRPPRIRSTSTSATSAARPRPVTGPG